MCVWRRVLNFTGLFVRGCNTTLERFLLCMHVYDSIFRIYTVWTSDIRYMCACYSEDIQCSTNTMHIQYIVNSTIPGTVAGRSDGRGSNQTSRRVVINRTIGSTTNARNQIQSYHKTHSKARQSHDRERFCFVPLPCCAAVHIRIGALNTVLSRDS